MACCWYNDVMDLTVQMILATEMAPSITVTAM